MTSAERHAYLARLAMEAWDRQNPAPTWSGRGPSQTSESWRGARRLFERAVHERMAQAAQTWTCEVDEAAQ